MNNKEDFFSYYRSIINSEFAMQEDVFEIYKDLLYETLDFFEKYDMLKGTVMSKVFIALYINAKKSKDELAYENWISPRALYNYRMQYNKFAFGIIKRRGLEVSIGKFLADTIE